MTEGGNVNKSTRHLHGNLTRLVFLGLLLLSTLLPMQAMLAGSATWKTSPAGVIWNDARHWTPRTVPNASEDIATFGPSKRSSVSISADTEVDSIVFGAGASGFTIGQGRQFVSSTLTLSGAGIVNNSGALQNFRAEVNVVGSPGTIQFLNGANAGTLTNFTAVGGAGSSTEILFFNSSSAGSAMFVNEGGGGGTAGGLIAFHDESTANTAAFVTNGGAFPNAIGALTVFTQGATADRGNFTTNGGVRSGAGGGTTEFSDTTTAASGIFVTNGGDAVGASGGSLIFVFASSAGTGTFTTMEG